MDSLWAARKEALWATLAVRPEGTSAWSTDVAVPISQMAKLIGKSDISRENHYVLIIAIAMSQEDASKLGLFNSIVAHAGDGNFHQCVMYHPASPEERQAVQECVDLMMRRALEMEGTVSVSASHFSLLL